MGLPEEILYSLFGNIATMYTYLEKEESGDDIMIDKLSVKEYEDPFKG